MKYRVGAIAAVFGVLVVLFCWGIILAGKFFDENKIVAHQVLKVEIKPPFTIEKRIIEPEKKATQGAFITPEITPTPTVIRSSKKIVPKAEAQTSVLTGKYVYEGKVSHYSRSGCLGCSPNAVMGNGEALDDSKYTIAVQCELILNKTLNYNMKAIVTNLDNNKSVVARITDCGGFSKYNRIADLTPAIAGELGTKTDVTNVRLEII